MRDPKRIDKFCDRLKAVWHCVPDWRFGQLISNVLGDKDNFYTEDDEMIKKFEAYFDRECPLGGDPTGDCDGCAYSGDYHFVDGECIRREE